MIERAPSRPPRRRSRTGASPARRWASSPPMGGAGDPRRRHGRARARARAADRRPLVRPRLAHQGDRHHDDDPALAEQGRLDLDRPLTDAIPDLRQYDVANAAERRLTFRDCLAHRTFLPAVEPIYTYGDDPARLRAFVLQREWRHGPPVYSDINFILLGIAIERITGAAAVRLAARRRAWASARRRARRSRPKPAPGAAGC